MRIHFIAIGGSVMHNLAISLAKLGHQVTGSDDQIVEPSKSRLQEAGLLPTKIGWDGDRITSDIDAVILGNTPQQTMLNWQRRKSWALTFIHFRSSCTSTASIRRG